MGTTSRNLLREGPREKLAHNGLDTLSDSELLALILATGNRKNNALDLARKILEEYEDDLHQLATADLADLMIHIGIGEAKASRICATFELGRRRDKTIRDTKIKITSSRDVYNAMASMLKDKSYEEFWMLILSRSNQIIRKLKISEGSISGTVADPKKIFKFALQFKGSSLVFLHNHPSGNLKPSQSDIDLTKKLVGAGKMLDIHVLDHLIITQSGYFSFADEALL